MSVCVTSLENKCPRLDVGVLLHAQFVIFVCKPVNEAVASALLGQTRASSSAILSTVYNSRINSGDVIQILQRQTARL